MHGPTATTPRRHTALMIIAVVLAVVITFLIQGWAGVFIGRAQRAAAIDGAVQTTHPAATGITVDGLEVRWRDHDRDCRGQLAGPHYTDVIHITCT